MPRVLIVEDDPDQRQIYAALLYYNGFDVDEAGDVLGAIDLLQRRQPDAILMDIILPGTSGLDAAELVRSVPTMARIPMVGMSAYEIGDARVRAAGFNEFFRKPIRPETLVRAMRRAIGPESQRTSTPPRSAA